MKPSGSNKANEQKISIPISLQMSKIWKGVPSSLKTSHCPMTSQRKRGPAVFPSARPEQASLEPLPLGEPVGGGPARPQDKVPQHGDTCAQEGPLVTSQLARRQKAPSPPQERRGAQGCFGSRSGPSCKLAVNTCRVKRGCGFPLWASCLSFLHCKQN